LFKNIEEHYAYADDQDEIYEETNEKYDLLDAN
jgi:hypothetical protein